MALRRQCIRRISTAFCFSGIIYLALYSMSLLPMNNTIYNYKLQGHIHPNATIEANKQPSDIHDQPSVSTYNSEEAKWDEKTQSKSTQMLEVSNAIIDSSAPSVASASSQSITTSVLSKESDMNQLAYDRIPSTFINGEILVCTSVNKTEFELSNYSVSNITNGSLGDFNTLHTKLYSKLFPCDDYTPRSYYGQRGDYWVLYNYFKATNSFRCDNSVTYTTHGDWKYLDNLVPLLDRWQGPLQLALYSPGTDYYVSLQRIQYLRECIASKWVKELVTFHIYFEQNHMPTDKILHNPESITVNCTTLRDFNGNVKDLLTYRNMNNLTYPVNVARNLAREMSSTYYVLPSDIELYPNPGLISDFLSMIRKNDTMLQRQGPKVFVLSVFEVEANMTTLPNKKEDVILMLHNQSAVPFHQYVCADCHRIPKADEWRKLTIEPGLNVFHVAKRYKPYHHWEPFYIGTKYDPIYDERLSWEGKRDKIIQGYALCVLDYEFHILDNAFLVHRPGIKRFNPDPQRNILVAKQNAVIDKIIVPELKQIYGVRPGCYA